MCCLGDFFCNANTIRNEWFRVNDKTFGQVWIYMSARKDIISQQMKKAKTMTKGKVSDNIDEIKYSDMQD